MAAPRRGRRTGADDAAGSAGDGVRRARGPAGDHRSVHHDPVPDRLRRVRPVADSRARSGLVAGADDRGDDPADRRLERQSRARDRAGVDARADRRGDHDHGGDREARVRRRPALQADADRLHERPRADDPDRAAPEAVRVLRRRERADQRGPRIRGRAHLGRCRRRRRRDRTGQPRGDPGASGAGCRGSPACWLRWSPRSRHRRCSISADHGVSLVGDAPEGVSAADRAQPDLRSSAAGRGSGWGSRSSRSPTRSRQPRRSPLAPGRRSTATAR